MKVYSVNLFSYYSMTMKRIILPFFLIASGMTITAQVGVAVDNADVEPHEHAILHVKSTTDLPNKGVLFPKVKNKTKMPYYDSSEPDHYGDDSTLEGSFVYSSDDGTFYMYDGEKWTSAGAEVNNNTEGISRFVGKDNDDKVSVACVLGICGDGDKVRFRGDDGEIMNELEISPTSANQNEFVITKAGTYAITAKVTGVNVNIGGSLLGNAIIQVKRNGASDFEEVARSTYAAVTWAGSGGSDKLGAVARTILYLEENDEVRVWFGRSGNCFAGGIDCTNDYTDRRYNVLTFEKYKEPN